MEPRSSFLDGYLYSAWNGVFTVYEGRLYQLSNCRYFTFICSNFKKRFICSQKEGEVYNAILWFRSRDDEKAQKLFEIYEHDAIKKHEQKIESHKSKIKVYSQRPILK